MFTPPIRQLFLLSLVLMAAGLSACSHDDDIRAYTVPKASPPPQVAATATPNPAAKGGARLLAAIVPRTSEVWHFKLMGPSALVSPEAGAFAKFIESVKFKTTKAVDGSDIVTPNWTLPKGWVQGPGNEMRYATIAIGESAHGLELRVFRFGPESGKILENVQRWAEQVGVGDVTNANLADMTRPIVVDDQPATLVDVTGPGSASDPAMAGPVRPKQPQPPAPPGKPERLVAPAPQGWTQDPNPSQILVAKYDLTKDGKTATLTVSSAGGDIEANLNRWREQVGLPDWTEETIQKAFEDGKELVQGTIADRRAILVDIVGPDSAGEKRERILGALTRNETGGLWFIKLRGPADLIASQKETFEAFLKSVRFEN